MTLTVAAFREGDRAEVLELWRRVFADDPDPPAGRLARALAAPGSAVFVAREQDSFAGTAVAGSDGIRGWLHYVAVVPARRRRGVARALVRHAEAWLAMKGVHEVMLLVRDDAAEPAESWRRLGYAADGGRSMGRRIDPTPGASLPRAASGEPGCIDVVVTHLEMTAPPAAAAPKPPALKLAVLRATDIAPAYYRFLYAETGRDWVWYERRAMSDAELSTALGAPGVEVYVLHVGGQPAGYVEFDFGRLPDEAELRYFGLMPQFIGRGLGPFLLDWAVREAWRRAPRRIYVNTCTLDHPRALALYQRAGFAAFRQETKTVRDPRPLP